MIALSLNLKLLIFNGTLSVISHNATLPFSYPTRITLLSLLIATDVTAPVLNRSFNVYNNWPVTDIHTLTDLSTEPVTANDPSSDNATDVIGPLWPTNFCRRNPMDGSYSSAELLDEPVNSYRPQGVTATDRMGESRVYDSCRIPCIVRNDEENPSFCPIAATMSSEPYWSWFMATAVTGCIVWYVLRQSPVCVLHNLANPSLLPVNTNPEIL